MTVTAVLVDIEGTTSSISFVHDVLFPYARAALPDFLARHAKRADVAAEMRATAAISNVDADDPAVVAAVLQGWIDEDRKATPLKTLQGMIWEDGYAAGAYRAHVYDDAVEALQSWHALGLPIHIYSSGSVHAQKLFFAHSEAGDLLPLFAGHFDTTIGAKREAGAYACIAEALARPAGDILFLSDVEAELDAARAAGMRTTWVIRENEGVHSLADAAGSTHRIVTRLTDVVLD